MDSVRNDIRLAFRTFRARPGFVFSVVFILALGIGANTAIFSVVDAVLFHPLRGAHKPRELFRIFSAPEGKKILMGIPFPVFKEFRAHSRTVGGIAAFNNWGAMDFSMPGHAPDRIPACLISGNYFDVLGIQPELGRLINDSDEHNTENPVVLSDLFWKTRFGADPKVIGSKILLNGHSFTIIGVAPADFISVSLDARPDVWAPIQAIGKVEPQFAEYLNDYSFEFWYMFARLRPGIKPEQAQSELRVIASGLREWQSARFGLDPMVTVLPPGETVDWDAPHSIRASWALVGIAALMLMMSCAVAAGLFVLRAEQRHHEISIRLAVGASRRRILRQLLIESLLLASGAAVVGFFLASWIAELLITITPDKFPIPLFAASSALDLRMLAITILISLVSAILFGFVPAIRASRFPLLSSLQKEVGSSGSPRFSLQEITVVLQVALCAVLLAGSGLLLRTLWNMNKVEPGFPTDSAFTVTMDLSKEGYTEKSGRVFYSELLQKMDRNPQIVSAGLAHYVPIQHVAPMGFRYDSADLNPDNILMTGFNVVTPGYFKSLGVHLLLGRDFNATDNSNGARVVIINQAMAERYWPGQTVIGKTIARVGRRQPLKIIGVVTNAKYDSLRKPAGPMMYLPLEQYYKPEMTLLVRATGNPAAILPALKQAVSELNPNVPLYSTGTLRGRVSDSLAQERLLAHLVSAFGILALLLTAGGLYSVIAYSIELRTREIGVRIALGASRYNVRTFILSRGLFLTAIGLIPGLIAAFLFSRLIASFLFGVAPTDLFTYFGIIVVMITSSLIACSLPARRATQINPIEALRYE